MAIALRAANARRAAEQEIVPSRYHVGLVTVLGAIFLAALAPKLDTDLWWHLKDGEYIASHHAVVTRDYLSFTFAGHPWTDHEWLADLFLYGCYRLAGIWGTVIAFAAIICSAFGLVYARMAQAGVHRLLALFVLTAAFFSSSNTWGARPQMLTLLFLAAFALVLDRWIATHDRRLLAIFPLLTLLWTNLHGGWVLGLALLILSLAGEWFNRLAGKPDALELRELRALAIAIGISIVSTAINPAGIREVLYPLVWIFPSAYSNVLTEWVSTDFHQPVAMVFEGLLLVLLASLMISRTPVNWRHLILILAFTHLALSQSRNVAVWAIIISPLVALYLESALHAVFPGRVAAGRPGLRPRLERTINLVIMAAALLAYILETLHYATSDAVRHAEAATYPAGATAYMQTHHLPPHTFTAYAWGGYLLWRTYPTYRDFIDGRANTLFDERILHDYLVAYEAAPGWRGVLRRYGVQNVLVGPDAPLAQLLAVQPDWRQVYHDGVAVLYTHSATHSPH